MKSNFTNEDFEHFLQENADQFRLQPSPGTWKNISGTMNKRRRTKYIVAASLFLFLFAGGYFALNHTTVLGDASRSEQTPRQVIQHTPAPTVTQPDVTKGSSPALTKKSTTPLLLYKRLQKGSVIFLDNLDDNPIAYVPYFTIPEVDLPIINLHSQAIDPEEPAFADALPPSPENLSAPNADLAVNELLSPEQTLGSLPGPDADNPLPETPATVAINNVNIPNKTPEVQLIKPESKLTWQVYVSPTISYRKLSENKKYPRQISTIGVPSNYTALYNVNSAVTHKPDIGLEFGLAGKLQLARNFKLRSGLQFNISRYDIKAFSYVPEVATIALNNRYRMESVNTISNYRNFNGGKSNWLQNFYFQASVPVGLEAKVHGNDRMSVGVSGTVQPTYVIGDRAYLITSDYKNYAEVPWLIRRWNVNTSFETFVSYSAGKTKWQIGPQVRYQLLSSFVNKYPVKENLFDFGLKVGVTLNQRR